MSYQALLFCPDEKTARVVTQVLSELDFSVEPCTEPFAAVKKLMGQHFDAIVVDCENEQNATLLFKSAHNSASNQSALAVAVVEGQAGVAKAFRIGANLVLTKPINVEQSKGTLRVARGLLRRTTDAAKSSPAQAAAQQPAFGPVSGPQPAVPVAAASSSLFDLEQEPAPEPDPADAALLEYMSDPLPAATSQPTSPAAKTESPKDYPWLPVSQTHAEPMASALRHAAEAAGRQSPAEVPVASTPSGVADASAKAKEIRPSGGSLFSGHAAASAPAPAKEMPWLSTPAFEPHREVAKAAAAPAKTGEIRSKPSTKKSSAVATSASAVEAPMFSTLEGGEREAEDVPGSKRTLRIVAAAIVIAAVGGYFGWTMLHRGGKQSVGQQGVASAPLPVPQATSFGQQPAAPATLPPGSQGTSAQQIESSQLSQPTKAPAQSKKLVESIVAEDGPVKVTRTPEPVAKNEVFKLRPPKPAAQEEAIQPPAPGVLGDTGSEDSAISGIVSATPVNVPKPPLQTLKISQGVSQGLLIKKVQPIYPSQALQMHLKGAVQLRALISKDGTISNLKVLSGDAILARAAMDAVRQWKYKPYYLNTEPVEIQTQITVNFKLP